ncbi:MAG TPA: lipopolysaccharide assembly protein LapB [Candidatus Binatia bacterium]|nr:lipopolysaccharide assembly protein LapB [Candidatus Binatia bacterium]
MPDSLALAWLMLPLGAALGWYLARRWPGPQEQAHASSPEYLSGLAHLVEQDPDRAIAAFVKAIEIDDETIELHLTLGSLFRKRGEVDRALRIHQNLLERETLKPAYRNQARFELAQDFHKAGVMDRAESLFKELVAQGTFLQPSLEHLASLHEQSRDWPQAIEAVRQLQAAKSTDLRPLIAQYYCERCDEASRRKDPTEAARLAGRALAEHPDCVRASLQLGALHEAAGDFTAAVKAYRRVPEQDPRYLGEALAPMRRSYEALHDLASYWKFLQEAEELWPQPAVVLAKAQLMRSEQVDALPYLAEQLQKQPQWGGLDLLLETAAEQVAGAAPVLGRLREVLHRTLEKRPRYQCQQCGFQPGLLFWQCPRCKSWSTILPLPDFPAAKAA